MVKDPLAFLRKTSIVRHFIWRVLAPDIHKGEEVIGELKSNKVADIDCQLLCIWKEKLLPNEWTEGTVGPIYLKSDKLDDYYATRLLSSSKSPSVTECK